VGKLEDERPEVVRCERVAHADRVARRGNFVSARMICVTRAREIPARRAISAPEATSPVSSYRCRAVIPTP
jgi:hypothetical protein